MAQISIQRNQQQFWSVHTHSKYSYNDALPDVRELVRQAKLLGYRGLALTDHGNMAGSVKLYTEAAKQGIKPFPGSEMYVVRERSDKKAKRYHLGLVAYTTQGYRNLVGISTRSFRQFHNKPLLDLADLAEIADNGQSRGIALTTGCFFGLVVQTLINDGEGAARRMLSSYASWFRTYVEIQAHHIDHGQDSLSEQEISDWLFKTATELGLPVVITQDSHYIKKSDRSHHESLKRLVAFGPDPDDAVFPGDGFHLVDDAWMEAHHSTQVYQAGLAGLQDLLDQHDMAISEMDKYSFRVPHVSADPETDLLRRCTRELLRRGKTQQRYVDRLNEELDVLKAAGMSDYLLLVAQVCDHLREVDIFYQTRGSAAGSLLCWLLDISNLDPIKWKLRFDRFLTKDRAKPPDIDLDVDQTRRKELLEWLAGRYACVQIGTWGTYSIQGDEEGKGSLRVRYMSRLRKQDGEADWTKVSKENRVELDQLSALELYSGYGTHAAGVILCNSRDELETKVPLMYVASSKTYVSQYDMKDVEAIGLVKLDALGLATMAVLRQTVINLGRDPKDGLDFIPLNDYKCIHMLAKGDTSGVFQLEGKTNAREIKRLRPTKIGDLIAAMALYRPGVMRSGAMETYYRRRRKDEQIPAQHPIIEHATKETYGILLYQDQVIDVLRGIGMNVDDLNEFLKAVKASNKNIAAATVTFTKYSEQVKEMCRAKGMDEGDIEWLWNALKAFADYSFNRAHATVYGITAYRCAYLATNHPLEFHAALLAVAAGTDKEKVYSSTARGRGMKILPADVNYSRVGFSVDERRRGIRRGLLSVRGLGPIGAKAIETHQPFTNIDDFMDKIPPRAVPRGKDYRKTKNVDDLTGAAFALYEANAFSSIKED